MRSCRIHGGWGGEGRGGGGEETAMDAADRHGMHCRKPINSKDKQLGKMKGVW